MSDPAKAPEAPKEEASPSKLSEVHRKRVASWYAEKVKDTASHGCSVCGSKDWLLLDDFVAPANFAAEGGLLLGGAVYPHFMLICKTCSNVNFINAIRAGVMDRDPPA